MVRLLLFLNLLLCSKASAELSIKSVNARSVTVFTIKPCQPVSIAIEMRLQGDLEKTTLDSVRGLIGSRVALNGRAIPSRENGTNSIAFIELDPSSLRPTDWGDSLVDAVILFYWDMDTSTCLFDRAGQYELDLVGELKIHVTVESPSIREEGVLRQLRELGVELWAGLSNPGDVQRTLTLLPKLSKTLEDAAGTSYADFLSPYVGLGKLNQSLADIELQANIDTKTYLATRVETSRVYVVPYVKNIDLPFKAQAAFIAVNDLVSEAKVAKRDQPLPPVAVDLLSEIIKSPISGRYREEGRKTLKKMDTNK